MSNIYLAGGMHGGWREEVRSQVDATFFDPADHWLDTLEEFGTWDLHHVKQADLVFTYIERTNPSCIGAAIETGFAARDTTVVLVLEQNHQHFKDRYLNFFRKVADLAYTDLSDGIDYLQSYA